MDALLIILRAVQCVSAAVLFGAPLFAIYALPHQGPLAAASLAWPRRMIWVSAAVLALAALLALLVQTAILAGSFGEAVQPDSIQVVVTGTRFGPAAFVRALAALASLACLSLRPGWRAPAAFGAVGMASLAWMGHGPSTEGAAKWVHLGADVAHVLAAGVWLGALPMFVGLLWEAGHRPSAVMQPLHRALDGFGGIGVGSVAVIVASGLVNSWFLVGPTRIAGLFITLYGWLLTAKLVLFAGMLALAATHRFKHTPTLGSALDEDSDTKAVVLKLRRSVVLETALGLGVLILVGWLGTLAPIASD